jgi:uncharacterized protein DUF6624
MQKLIFLLPFLLLCESLFPQNKFIPDEQYFRLTGRASGLYQEKNFQQSGLVYDSAFQRGNGDGKVSDFYDAACTWSMAGNPDKAFGYLEKAAAGKLSSLSHTLGDNDLSGLHSDKRWQILIDKIRRNKEEKDAGLVYKGLADTLDRVYTDDQQYRQRIDSVQRKYGWESAQMDSLMKIMEIKDSVNLVIVESILGHYGWLGPDEVGEGGATALFLVIQHSDSLTQNIYVPMMRVAVQKGKAKPEHLALLEDRILTEQGKEQIYGSQVRTVAGKASFFPILDEANVNKRRASVGLGPLEDYARYYGIDYHLPAAKPVLKEPGK